MSEQVNISTNAEELGALLNKKGKKKPKKKIIIILCILLAVVTAGVFIINAFMTGGEKSSGTPTYREYTAQYGDISVGQTESSSISLDRVSITFPASATVLEVYVKAGSAVSTGDAIVKLDSDEVAESLASYELQLEKAALELEQAKLSRQTSLLKAEQTLQSSLQTGNLASVTAQNTLTQLETNLENAKKSLADSEEKLDEYNKMNSTFAYDYSLLCKYEDALEEAQDYLGELKAEQSKISGYESSASSYNKVIAEYDALYEKIERAEEAYSEAASERTAAKAAITAKEKEYSDLQDELSALQSAASPDAAAIAAVQAEIAAAKSALYDKNSSLAAAYNSANDAYYDARDEINDAEDELEALEDKYGDYDDLVDRRDEYKDDANSVNTLTLSEEISDAQDEVDDAQDEYNEFKEYFNDTYGNIGELSDLLDAIDTQKSNVKSAELKLSETETSYTVGATKANQTKATSAAEAEVAETTYELSLMKLDQSVKTAEEQYNGLLEQLDEVRSLIADDGIIRSTCNGTVASVNVEAGDVLSVFINEDTYKIQAYASIATITDISSVYVPITISEEDILNISIGQSANVTMTAFAGTTFDAEVDTISVESSRSGAATVSYSVNVVFSEENKLNMYEGMSAEVTLLQREASNVLYISNQAVTNVGGRATVNLKGADGNPVLTEIKTGFSDGTYVEVLSGISAGDTVLVERGATGK